MAEEHVTTLGALLEFVEHKYNCDFLQPMWNQGPCDCGLFALFEALDSRESHLAGVNVFAEILQSNAFKRWKNRPEHER